MKYREPLPDGCPPCEADEINKPLIVYRLVQNNPPTDDDFRSLQYENPTRRFPRRAQCRARGVSVRTDSDDAAELMLLPSMRGKMICEVRLDSGAGCIMQTGKWPHHSTWWPLAKFDILAKCSVVTP